MYNIAKDKTVNLRDSVATVWRIRLPDLSGFEKARQAWAGGGRAARGAILVYAQAREARRRPKIADAFFEPNSTHFTRKTLLIYELALHQTNKFVLHP